CGSRWRRGPSSCPPSSSGYPTGAIARSSRNRWRSRPPDPETMPCGRTSAATSPSWSDMSATTPTRGTAATPSVTIPRGGNPRSAGAAGADGGDEEGVVVAGELLHVGENLRLLEARFLERLPPVAGSQEAVVGTGRGVGRDAGEVLEEVEDELHVDRLPLEGPHALGEDRAAAGLERLADPPQVRVQLPRAVHAVDRVHDVGDSPGDALLLEVPVHVH